ncbi:hypothetical protein [Umezawaea beigongshangensis]|uniref:hypothetical protein n=1 Tax=Umezawaea beigongshangensis TaxID=2780383 RepID=UPI0018F14FC6|nr:hypothetical protein [Umezawaea beigongshangensis]
MATAPDPDRSPVRHRATTVERLVPDSAMTATLLDRVEEFLRMLAGAERCLGADRSLPPPIAHGATLEALHRVRTAIWPQLHVIAGTDGPRMVTPHGVRLHSPLRVVRLRSDDLDVLDAAVQVCSLALITGPAVGSQHAEDLAVVLDEVGRRSGYRPPAATRVIAPLSRLCVVLTLADDDDTRSLRTAISLAPSPADDVELTLAQEIAYQRFFGRLIAQLADDDNPLSSRA